MVYGVEGCFILDGKNISGVEINDLVQHYAKEKEFYISGEFGNETTEEIEFKGVVESQITECVEISDLICTFAEDNEILFGGIVYIIPEE